MECHPYECGVRGEGLVNAFIAHEKFWQERHIVKDYIMENQSEGIDDIRNWVDVGNM